MAEKRSYVTVGLERGDALVGAVSTEGRTLWNNIVPTGEQFPVGMYLEGSGDLVVIDAQAYRYRLTPTGELIPRSGADLADSSAVVLDDLHRVIENSQALPVRHVVAAPGGALSGYDGLLLVAPDREGSHVLCRAMIPHSTGYIFGGRGALTDGVGLENGETLNPLAVAYDRSRQRLVVLDAQGRLQVLDARPQDMARRYVTKWGGFGAGDGEFFVSPPTAAAVVADSQGRIYVADGVERVQVFVP